MLNNSTTSVLRGVLKSVNRMTEVKKPRQIMRDNVEAKSPEDYFRNSTTVAFLDYALNEMKTRFTDLHARTALGATVGSIYN